MGKNLQEILRLIHSSFGAGRVSRGRLKKQLRYLRPAAVIVSLAVFGVVASLLGATAFDALPVWATLGAMLLYLAAHILRAVRLAIIATPLLGISVRTAMLLHFAAAPIVTIVPLKFGELFRLQQLWLAGRSLPNAVISLLLDRLLDAAMLLLLLTWLVFTNAAEGIGAFIPILSTAGILTAIIVLFLGPQILESIQRYIMINHNTRTILKLLPIINLLRRGAEQGSGLLRRQGGTLVILSAIIWMLEIGAVAMFATHAVSTEMRNFAHTLLIRVTQEWHIATSIGSDPALAALAASSLLTLLVIWPLVLHTYMTRLVSEPLRRRNEIYHI